MCCFKAFIIYQVFVAIIIVVVVVDSVKIRHQLTGNKGKSFIIKYYLYPIRTCKNILHGKQISCNKISQKNSYSCNFHVSSN